MDTENRMIQLLQATEQEILDVIHQVCIEHDLRYSLAYGTLIGAVRHHGFIPWDDDIDIIMPREDYEQLLKVWQEAAPEGYILQNSRTDRDFSQNFTKIRKDHTTFLQSESERDKKYHKGIFVDIFPGDRVAPNKFGKIIQFCACALNLLYTRGFPSGSSGLVGLVENLLLKFPEKNFPIYRNRTEMLIRKWNDNTSAQYVFPSTIEFCKKYHSADLFECLKTIEFNGKQYLCVADPDKMLRQDYGDYMQLPPIEERIWKHHPVIVDFQHNFIEK